MNEEETLIRLYRQQTMFTLKLKQGFRVVHSEFGTNSVGKTTRAQAMAKRLRLKGDEVIIEEEIVYAHGLIGLRIFAKPKN